MVKTYLVHTILLAVAVEAVIHPVLVELTAMAAEETVEQTDLTVLLELLTLVVAQVAQVVLHRTLDKTLVVMPVQVLSSFVI